MGITEVLHNIGGFADKMANVVGLDYAPKGSTYGASGKIGSELMQSTGGAKSFSDFLCYKYFDETSSLFFSDEGWVGFLMELAPIVGADETLTKNLEHFFNDEMPGGSWIQFLLVASNDIGDIISHWKSARVSTIPALKKLEQGREKFLNHLSSSFKDSVGRTARNYKLYLVFSQKCSFSSSGAHKIKAFMQNLKQKLDSIDLNPRILGVEDLMGLVREILELDLERNKKGFRDRPRRYDPSRTIADQMLDIGRSHSIVDDRVEHYDSKLTSKCYFVSELPQEFSLNEMIGLLGDGARDNLAIPARFILSYTVASNLNKAAQGALVQKGERVIDSAEQWYSRNNRDIKRESAEWKDINDRAKNGEKFLTEYFQIMMTAPSDFIDEAEQSLFSLYNIMNWRLDINRHFQLPALLSILPMHSSILWTYLSQFKLARTALSSEVIVKLPIHAEWKGVPEPGMLLIGRRGQLFNWNPFYRISSGNYNVCVFGPSGSGKSVFLQELATSMMAQNVKVFILDIGQSFKNICELLGGEIIGFGKNSNIALNPFAGFAVDMSEEDRNIAITYAKAIVCSMCGAKGDNLKESTIEKAIAKGLEKHGGDLDVTKLAEVLLSIGQDGGNSEVATNLSLSLFSYSSEGLYGKFFGGNRAHSKEKKGNKEIKFDKQITVFEFEEIKNDQLLLAVVLQIIGMQIFMQVLTGDRSKRFVLIVDEAWMILDYAAKFLAELARTIRKYGGSLVVCVQNFTDLQGGDHHRAVLENSTWTVLLKQDEKGINAFKTSEAFKDMVPLIKSISISRDKYAEALLCATGVKVVGRLVLDNYSKILYSTDADVFKALNELTKSGVPLDEAVSIIAERKYGSV